MPRITIPVAEVKRVSEPVAAHSAAPVSDTATAPAVEVSVWRFVKNLNPHETIRFEDGEKFCWPGKLFETKDVVLAKKIKAVAIIFNIVEK